MSLDISPHHFLGLSLYDYLPKVADHRRAGDLVRVAHPQLGLADDVGYNELRSIHSLEVWRKQGEVRLLDMQVR